MVATSQPLASEAGLRVLQAGGTAADACVAAAAALNVTEPCSTGIGGDAFALFFDGKTKRVECLQGCGRSPAALTLEAVRAHPEFAGSQTLPKLGALSVTVPGAAAAWEAAVSRWGRLPLAQVLAPAVELAEEGFPVAPGAAHGWEKSEDLLRAAARGAPTAMLPGDRAPRAGEIFRNPDLGKTFRRLGEKGAKEGFYTGPVAEALVAALAARGGVMTLDDLAAHEAQFVEPVSTSYRDSVRLWECPPPTQGVTALMALNMLEISPAQARLSPQALHAQAESLRFAFADALQFCADPSVKGAPAAKNLLDKSRARKRWEPYFRADRRAPDLRPDDALRMAEAEARAGPDTVYLCAVDRWGNACSFINSNYEGFGTGIVPQGCGFTLQNRGHNFIVREGHPNCVGPRKFCYHTIIPGLVTHEASGELHSVLGVMGGFMQPQGHLQVLSAMVDYGLDPQAALDQPRFCLSGVDSALGPESARDSTLLLEEGLPLETKEELERMGHKCQVVSGWSRLVFGKGQVIRRDPATGVLMGGTEPRADGAALAW
eukprot:TRINITY_DN30779_c0_g1_i2.p1 TRINITY_DN30779_c0_g1~~TRINITY_DN30779_c0_g1_i2.p1  ORF type:complete len:614 (+),score=138.79 TRINITY_DN30779_c0_g1_i2:205-1842(+)